MFVIIAKQLATGIYFKPNWSESNIVTHLNLLQTKN